MSNESLVEIIAEYVDVIEETFGFYLDSVYGYNFLLKQFAKVQEEASKLLDFPIERLDTLPMSYGEGDPNLPGSEVYSYTTQGDFKTRINKHGTTSIKIGQMCVFQIYQYWEDHYRKKIAEAIGTSKNDINIDIFGDLRLIRNSIIHHRGIALPTIINCKKIKLFHQGQVIDFTQNDVIDLVDRIKKDLNEFKENYIC